MKLNKTTKFAVLGLLVLVVLAAAATFLRPSSQVFPVEESDLQPDQFGAEPAAAEERPADDYEKPAKPVIHADAVDDLILSPVPKKLEPKKEENHPLEQIEEDVKQYDLGKVDADAVQAEGPKEYPPFIQLDPIDDYKFDLLIESLISREPLDFPIEAPSGGDSGMPWQEFLKDDTFQIVGDLYETIIRFEYAGKLDPGSNKLPAFHVSVRFEEDRPIAERRAIDPNADSNALFRKGESVVIRHSHPKKKAEAGGIRVPVTFDRQRRLMLEGRNQSSMVLLIPQVRRSGTRGLLICPRDYDIWKVRSGYRSLDITGHEMVGVEIDARGTAKAGVHSGFGPGLARAVIQTTKNIQRGTFIVDESRIQYPFVDLEYIPLNTERRPLVRNSQSITGGIRLETIHHNSLNHKTKSVGTVVSTIKRVELKRNLLMKLKENEFRVKKGICYALLKESRFEQRFLKELLPKNDE